MKTKIMLAAFALIGAAGLANGQITITGDLTNGATQVGSVTGSGTGNSAGWGWYTFSANAGDSIAIDVNRLVGDLDPASGCWEGDATGDAVGDFSSIFINGTSLALVGSGDDNVGPNLPGPWGDPSYGFIAPSTGIYSVAVASFASTGQPPYRFDITVTGSTVPAPGAAALLGLGGFVATRRRRA